MKTTKTPAGPFPERPYYEHSDIEITAIDALRSVDLLPESPEPIRVERFIEKKFQIIPEYDNLPGGLLGFTEFGPNGTKRVVVSRSLSEVRSRAAERMVNSTLAHESGHILLHGYLFALKYLEGSRTMFGEDMGVSDRTVLCREENVSGSHIQPTRPRYDGRWWEYQANLVIGALLLPRPLVDMALGDVLTRPSVLGIRNLPPERNEEAIQLLSEAFDVNPIVARIRIQEVFPDANQGQLTL